MTILKTTVPIKLDDYCALKIGIRLVRGYFTREQPQGTIICETRYHIKSLE